MVTTNTDWTVARTTAMATTLNGVSGQLATVRSANENAFLAQLAAANNKEMWLAGNDLTVEGTWRWQTAGADTDPYWQGTSTGIRLNNAYTNWATGEPNDNGGTGDYMVMYTSGLWDDEANNGSAVANGYFIEWNADDVLDATNALTYSVTSQTVAGAFAINSDTGVITVANGALLNFEAQTSHTITVRTTDGSGTTFDRNFTIALNNLVEENHAPSDLASGINLNTDGGNNAYLITSNGGSVFGGRTALTVETTFAIINNASLDNPLVSYNVSGSDNELLLMVTSAGRISFAVDGLTTTSTGVFAQLLDGKAHTVSVSWDNSQGDLRYYVDGQLVETRTGIKTGVTLGGGGTLVVGQEQDSVDGGYVTNQRLSGTVYDLRVWNNAISDEQISLNYQQVPGSTETGLVANWRMSGISGGTTVVDSVSGINLTLANIAVAGGFTASTTTAGLSVTENASVGTRVGQVIATDPDISRDIIQDGLFREAANPGTFTNYTTGQSIGNWTVQSGDVDLIGTSFQSSPLGGRSIDLNGTNPGAIAQNLTTVAGRQYQVIFNASGNWGAGDAIKDFRVSAAGTSHDFSLSAPTGWSASNMLFSNRSMTFVADSNSPTLAFQSLDSGANGAMIADVRVIEIPQAVQTLLSSDPTLSYDAATGKFYRAVASNQSFTNAQTAAIGATVNGISGQLVTIGSRYENDLVWSMARSINSNIWLGASDAATEGTWRWFSGTNAATTFWVGTSTGTLQSGTYANWLSGEPNDAGGNEDHLTMGVSDGLWNDASGSNVPRAYIIEWDASEVLSNLRYTITSDPTGAFAIDANTGEVTVANATPLNEIAINPSITVQVTDAAGNSYSESFTISVNRVNDNTPIITSNGGGATASVSVTENSTSITTVTATDADLPTPSLTYSIVGGADQALFTINSSTGALAFASARNFETPTDAGADNVYDVIVRSSDGTLFDDQTIAVTVTNVNEAPTDLYSVPAVSDANVLGYYSFTSANNLGRDDAGGTSPITFSGTVAQTTGPSGSGALDLSGGAHGNIASLTTGGAMTIASWVRFDSTSGAGWDRVIDLGQANSGGIGNVYIGRMGTTNDLTFTIEKNGVYTHRATLTNGIVTGTWMHVAGTVDAAGNMTLYVNGAAVATAVGVAPDIGVRTNHYIGRSNWAGDGAFDGAIDDLLITSGAMSATSIANLHQQSNPLTIAENTANGTLLTTVYATDPDAANTYTYSLTNNAGGRFAIDQTTGQITVANSSLLNFEAATSHSITVRVTDQSGLTYDEVITVNLSNVNEASSFNNLNGTPTYIENGSAVVLDADVTITDPEFAASNNFNGSTLTLVRSGGANSQDAFSASGTLSTLTQGGNLVVSGTTIGTVTTNSNGTLLLTFNANATGALVNSAMQQIAYSNSSDAPPANVQVNWTFNDNNTGSQGTGGALTATGSVVVNITAVNDAPVMIAATPTLPLTEDGGAFSASIASLLGSSVSDVDSGAVEGIAITSLTLAGGTLQYSIDGTNWITVSGVSPTNALLLRETDQLRFTPSSTNGGQTLIGYRAWDQTSGTAGGVADTTTHGGTTAFSSTVNSITVNVASVNDAPTITDGSTYALSTTNEDTTSTGTLISTLLSSSNLADVDSGALSGVAITAATGIGTWQYSTDGTSWRDFGLVSSANSLLITSSSQVRYIPNANNGETATFSYRAWDQTSGTASTNATANYAATTSHGGTTAFSSSVATASIVVSGVNDAPVLDNTGNMTLVSINEDQTTNSGQSVASIISSTGGDRITDVDSGATEGIAITATTNGNGFWEYSTNNGLSWNAVGSVASNSALLLRSTDLVRFVPNGENATTGDLTFRAWDQTSGTFGTKADTSTNGGNSEFSTATEIASITVTAVNDEQVLTTNTGSTVAENSLGNILSAAMLATTDVDHSASQLTYTVTSSTTNGTLRRSGVALTLNSTFTQADVDAGLITYDHNGSETSSDAFSFSVDDGTGTQSTGTFNLTITPVNDHAPVINSNGAGATASISIAENTSAVTTVTATDGDLPAQTLTYTIIGGADSGLFTINTSTGALSFVSGRDRETHTDANSNGIYEVTVQASDGTLTDTQAISVTITDVDEFDVGPITDANATANEINENVAIGSLVGVQASAADLDSTNNTITYSLTSNPDNLFQIDPNTGFVTTAVAIDREVHGQTRSITVQAQSSDGSTSTQTFNITINDLDEFNVTTPTDTNAAANEINENVAIGTTVGITANASDLDSTNNTITYSLTSNPDNLFQIDPNTGVVTTAVAIDRETHGQNRSITVQAQSSDGSTSNQTFNITINDLDEFNVTTPTDVDAAANEVNENIPIGTTVGVTATPSTWTPPTTPSPTA